MSKKEIAEIIKLLNIGILPTNLDFSLKAETGYDLNKVKYNTFYKSFEYFDSKFPDGMENLPGYYKIIDHMIDNAKTPLEEITERQKEKCDDIYINE
jgi:hypothetical protein